MAGTVPSQTSYQTTRLGPGRHDGPGKVVCVMELASMLSGERFSDRPASVCPVVGAILRTYNDNVDEARRQDLYRFAAEAVGTRGDYALQRRRASSALEWVRRGSGAPEGGGRRSLRRLPEEPPADAGPERVAEYVVASIPRSALLLPGKGRWSDSSHQALIGLVDDLIEMGSIEMEPLLGEFVDEPARALEAMVPPVSPQEAFELVLSSSQVESVQSDAAHVFDLGADLNAISDHPGPAEQPAPVVGEPRIEPKLPQPPVVNIPPVRRTAAGHRPKLTRHGLERSVEVLGGITLVALACAASKRRG